MFLALVIQHAKRMGRIILSSVAWPAVQYFPTLFHNRHDFRGGITEHKMCCHFLYNFFLKSLLFQEEFNDILSLMYKGLQAKFPLLTKLEISPDFRKVLKSRSLCLSAQWQPSCSTGRTDITKLIFAILRKRLKRDKIVSERKRKPGAHLFLVYSI